MGELNKRGASGAGRKVIRLQDLTIEYWGGPTGTYTKSITLPDGYLWADVEVALLDCYERLLRPFSLMIVGETLYLLGDGWEIVSNNIAFSGDTLQFLSKSGFYRPVGFIGVIKS